MDPNRQIDLHSPNRSSSILRRRGLMVTSNRASEFGLTVSSGHMYLHWQESCQVQYDSADRYIYLESALDAEMNSGTSGCPSPGSLRQFAVYTMTKKRQTMRCGLEIWDTSVTSRAYCKYDWQVLWDQNGIWDGKHSGMMVVCKCLHFIFDSHFIHFTHIRKSVSSLFLRAFLVPRVLGPGSCSFAIDDKLHDVSDIDGVRQCTPANLAKWSECSQDPWVRQAPEDSHLQNSTGIEKMTCFSFFFLNMYFQLFSYFRHVPFISPS